MAEIFISYKAERRLAAQHLAKVLEAHGYTVWFDYGLIPGDDFEERLLLELSASKIVLVLWCTMSVKSKWVRKEARHARNNKKFLPCWLEASKLPEEFANADTINIAGWDGAPRSHLLDRLLDDIARRVGRDPANSWTALRRLEDNWRDFGAPSLAQFVLTDSPRARRESLRAAPPSSPKRRAIGRPPRGASPNFVQTWKRAQQGEAEALRQAGRAVSAGSGVTRNDALAVRLFELAIERGSVGAQASLGAMYAKGLGVPRDDREAVRLFKLAAAGDDARAQANLGYMYRTGRGGLRTNEIRATNLYRLGADKGDPLAQNNLGYMYECGFGGLRKNARMARRLYELAAEQGYARGQVSLGEMHEAGLAGLKKDEKEAIRLYKLAAAQNDERAREHLERLAARKPKSRRKVS